MDYWFQIQTDTDDWNTFHLIVNICNEKYPIPHDTACLDAMKELRKDKLLLQSDINEDDLLYHSCHPVQKLRFEYLAGWDPDNLMNGTYKGLPISHAIIKHHKDLDEFTMYVQTALKHHPQHLGLLFQKNSSGKTAYERTIEKHGHDKTFKVIKQCIPANTTISILHHVIKDTPKHINDFTIRYPSATYLRDENGRSFVQAELAEGTKIFAADGLLFTRMTDDEIAELDPVTNQYPFLTCASREACADLSTIYVLLSRNPSLLEKYIEQTKDEFAEEVRSRKRERDGDDVDEDSVYL